MIRFCRISPEAAEKFSVDNPHLVFSPDIWEQGRKFFAENPNVTQVPVTDRNGKLLCTAWFEEMAKQELRMLDEIISGGSSVYHFEDIYPNCDCVIINECNELAYYTAKYIKSRGIPVILRGRCWKYLDIESAPEDIEYVNAMNIYAEGTWEHTGDPRTEGIRSVSVEFDCIYYLYMKNVKDGRILRTSRTKEELFEYLKDKDIFLIGDSSGVQDVYDMLIGEGIDAAGFINKYSNFYLPNKKFGFSIKEIKEAASPVVINCIYENSLTGSTSLDSYVYCGFRRDKDYIYIRDYTDIPKTGLVNLLSGRNIVLAGDELLCRKVKDFLADNLKSAGNVVSVKDLKPLGEAGEDTVGVIVLPQFFANIYQGFGSKLLALKKELNGMGVKAVTEYFSDIDFFTRLNTEKKASFSPELRIKGVILGCMYHNSGTTFFRDCIDGHPNILQFGFNLFERNIFWYCIRLAGLNSSEVMPMFRKLIRSEKNYIENYVDFKDDFNDPELFEKEAERLIGKTDGAPSSQELFVIFCLSYNKMKGIKTGDISGYYIYWEPHSMPLEKTKHLAEWLNRADIDSRFFRGARNFISSMGSDIKLKAKNISNSVVGPCIRQCFEPRRFTIDGPDGVRALKFNFESVKTDPYAEWGRFCEELNIPWSDSFLRTTRWEKDKSYDLNPLHNTDIRGYDLRPVYNYYPEYFSSLDILRMQICQKDFQEEFGYPFESCSVFTRKEFQELLLKEFRFEKKATFGSGPEMLDYYSGKFRSVRIFCLEYLYNQSVLGLPDLSQIKASPDLFADKD